MEKLIKKSDAMDAVMWGNGLDGSVVDDICEKIEALPSADRPSGEVDAVKEYEHQVHNLDQGYITLGEFDKRIEPLRHLHYNRPQGWIPCSERMPEPGSWAIWCSIKGIIQVARWKEDAIDHFFPDQGFFDLEDAVAWMPLPKPYKEKEDAQ